MAATEYLTKALDEEAAARYLQSFAQVHDADPKTIQDQVANNSPLTRRRNSAADTGPELQNTLVDDPTWMNAETYATTQAALWDAPERYTDIVCLFLDCYRSNHHQLIISYFC
jgi:hypothetical protein